ncbi:MAG: bifunctional nuclease family protein [Bacteroidales bacterium]|nr:bifunctional nuclease family protein [Bacteroidales bacterium]
MQKVKLNILGLSFSQTQDNAYVLILVEEEGERRIPIIIGGAEAQAIAIQLENLKAPRPLTHDLFLNFANSFDIRITEVIIYKLQEGIFYSKIVCSDGKKIVEIDARTSDAVALAVRFGCPIFTSTDVITRAGIVLDLEKEVKSTTENTIENEFAQFNFDELQEMLDVAVLEEDYERASRIRDEIVKREKAKI